VQVKNLRALVSSLIDGWQWPRSFRCQLKSLYSSVNKLRQGTFVQCWAATKYQMFRAYCIHYMPVNYGSGTCTDWCYMTVDVKKQRLRIFALYPHK